MCYYQHFLSSKVQRWVGEHPAYCALEFLIFLSFFLFFYTKISSVKIKAQEPCMYMKEDQIFSNWLKDVLVRGLKWKYSQATGQVSLDVPPKFVFWPALTEARGSHGPVSRARSLRSFQKEKEKKKNGINSSSFRRFSSSRLFWQNGPVSFLLTNILLSLDAKPVFDATKRLLHVKILVALWVNTVCSLLRSVETKKVGTMVVGIRVPPSKPHLCQKQQWCFLLFKKEEGSVRMPLKATPDFIRLYESLWAFLVVQ